MEWISVKDKLPKKNEWCFFWYSGFKPLIGCYKDKGRWLCSEDNEFWVIEIDNITHWMLLPEAPKPKEYLDKEDIEELGYKVKEEKNDKGEVTRYNFCIDSSEFLEQNIVASYWLKQHHLIIHNFNWIIPNDKINDLVYYFIGRIRNKSELKILINQLELE